MSMFIDLSSLSTAQIHNQLRCLPTLVHIYLLFTLPLLSHPNKLSAPPTPRGFLAYFRQFVLHFMLLPAEMKAMQSK